MSAALKGSGEGVKSDLAPLYTWLEGVIHLNAVIVGSSGEARAQAERKLTELLVAPPVFPVPGNGLWRIVFERVAGPEQVVNDAPGVAATCH